MRERGQSREHHAAPTSARSSFNASGLFSLQTTLPISARPHGLPERGSIASGPEAFASVFHFLRWAVVTLTTVGYGDVTPVTVGGKVFTFFVLIVGLGIVAVPTGLFASALSKARVGASGRLLRSLPSWALSWLVCLTY